MLFIQNIFVLVSLFIITVTPSVGQEQPELHAAGVYEGRERTGGAIHGPRADILVDRPDKRVILVLGSYSPLRWFIETRPGTRIEAVYLHGYQPEKSEILLNGTTVSPQIIHDLRSTYRNEGPDFRRLVERLPELTGVSAVSSFHGAYGAPEEAWIIDQEIPVVLEKPDHLKDELDASALTPALRAALDVFGSGESSVAFDGEGFELTQGDQVSRYQVSLDVPGISHPIGAAFDAERGRLFGVSYGGEGFLYQFDIASRAWSVLKSMNQLDAYGMIYDAAKDRLIMGIQLGGSGFLIHNLSGNTEILEYNPNNIPGLADLGGMYGGAALMPVDIDGEKLLAVATGAFDLRQPSARAPLRTYVVDLETGAITLVAYQSLPER